MQAALTASSLHNSREVSRERGTNNPLFPSALICTLIACANPFSLRRPPCESFSDNVNESGFFCAEPACQMFDFNVAVGAFQICSVSLNEFHF